VAKKKWDNCALCGEFRKTTQEHVVPKSLFSPSIRARNYAPITIATCLECNNGSSDDDAHFRNVMLMAGAPNAPVHEIWDGAARRGFDKVDGRRRALDVFSVMKPVADLPGDQYMIYPANDPRIRGSVRKIARGLCHHHGLGSAIPDSQLFADVLRFPMPKAFIEEATYAHVEPEVFEYWFWTEADYPNFHSAWMLRIYQRTTFIVIFEKAAVESAPANNVE